MRVITIETRRPWLHPGYAVVGDGPYGRTRLRFDHRFIDDPAKAADHEAAIQRRDPNLEMIGVSEVRR